ncbi:hypothetical protein SAMN05444161_9187 [Rhizobiales bacterium GAS191]|nr:hypothetical protein SAMN05444161_9187 [Rhizobiales bacterium GAS191]
MIAHKPAAILMLACASQYFCRVCPLGRRRRDIALIREPRRSSVVRVQAIRNWGILGWPISGFPEKAPSARIWGGSPHRRARLYGSAAAAPRVTCYWSPTDSAAPTWQRWLAFAHRMSTFWQGEKQVSRRSSRNAPSVFRRRLCRAFMSAPRWNKISRLPRVRKCAKAGWPRYLSTNELAHRPRISPLFAPT